MCLSGCVSSSFGFVLYCFFLRWHRRTRRLHCVRRHNRSQVSHIVEARRTAAGSEAQIRAAARVRLCFYCRPPLLLLVVVFGSAVGDWLSLRCVLAAEVQLVVPQELKWNLVSFSLPCVVESHPVGSWKSQTITGHMLLLWKVNLPIKSLKCETVLMNSRCVQLYGSVPSAPL